MISMGSVCKRRLKRLQGSRKHAVDRGGHAHLLFHVVDLGGGLAQGHAGGEIEGDRDGRKLSLVIHGERRGGGLEVRDALSGTSPPLVGWM